MTAAYPGNATLPNEVKARVLSTFRQTLDLYNQAQLDDVIVGCDFLLKMDPLFEPAKKLREKAKNPAAPIDIQDLMAIAQAGAPPAPAADLSEARAALDAREFQRASDLASAALRSDMMNEEAQRIAQEASSKLEADPFVQQFAAKARQQLQAGDAGAARATMEKARSLDPDHPLLAEVAAEIDAPPAAKGFDPFAAFGAPQGDSPFGSFQAEAPKSESRGFAADSFVVEAPEKPASDARGAAPASDFGFKFEEEKDDGPVITIGHTQPGIFGFAGANAQEAAEATAGDTFDFSTASVDVSKEDQKKIEDYLAQGDIAYEAQDFQKAIDTWSRVFLIDVTNDQASERIERARLKKVAIDTQIDDLETEAIVLAEKKDRAGAKALYQKILQIDPSNANAIEQLALLDLAVPAASQPPPAPEAAPRAATPPPPPARTAAHPFDDNFFLDEPIGGRSVSKEILVPPDPASPAAMEDEEEAPAPAKKTRVAAEAPAGRSRTMLFGAIGLVILLVGGFAAWKFLAGGSGAGRAGDNTISRAQALADRGKYDQAIAMLLAIPPDHPNHDEALNLVAELKAKKGAGSGMIGGRPAAEVFAEKIQQGRAAYQRSDFAGAKVAFEQAAAIQPLPADAKQLYDGAGEQVRRLETAENLFKSGNFAEAATAAEAIRQENPNNTNAADLISRARFNMGVQALQEERLQDAISRFEEVLAANPNDEVARRARDLAIRYEETDRDLLYRIFVKYLKFR